MGDMHVDFVFGFQDHYFAPVALDPKYGQFKLVQLKFDIESAGDFTLE